MCITHKLIELIDSEETLRTNAILEARENKSLEKRAKELKAIMFSLADSDATPWFSFSVVSIVFNMVNWESIIRYFEQQELSK